MSYRLRVRRRIGSAIAVGCAALLAAAQVRAQEMQIIELRHRLADEVLPVVQPLVEPGGAITGTDNLLIVRTSAGNFAQIQQAVAALDRAARQLLISVGQGTVTRVDAASVQGSATIGGGDVQVGVNRPPSSGSGAEVRVQSRAQQANLHDVSSVRTLEGSEAYIAIGQSRPVTTTQVTPGWHGSTVTQTTEYRSASSGFYAIARINGDRVTLQISPQQQAFRSRGTIDSQGVVTTVSGLLGEWLAVGGVSEQGSVASGGLLTGGSRSSASDYTVWVKVEEIP